MKKSIFILGMSLFALCAHAQSKYNPSFKRYPAEGHFKSGDTVNIAVRKSFSKEVVKRPYVLISNAYALSRSSSHVYYDGIALYNDGVTKMGQRFSKLPGMQMQHYRY